jgi:hypothetical protein
MPTHRVIEERERVLPRAFPDSELTRSFAKRELRIVILQEITSRVGIALHSFRERAFAFKGTLIFKRFATANPRLLAERKIVKTSVHPRPREVNRRSGGQLALIDVAARVLAHEAIAISRVARLQKRDSQDPGVRRARAPHPPSRLARSSMATSALHTRVRARSQPVASTCA